MLYPHITQILIQSY